MILTYFEDERPAQPFETELTPQVSRSTAKKEYQYHPAV